MKQAMTHTSTEQSEALRLAHALGGGKLIDDSTEWADTLHAAAVELRRLHTRNAELEAQLSTIGAIGAIGVEPLRKQAAPDECKAFEAWATANNKYHVSGYNPHSDLWEAWQAARRARVAAVDRVIAAQIKQGGQA